MSTYVIIEDRQPMDGEFLDKEHLFTSLPFADCGARVMAFDLDEAMSDGSTQLRDCTEDMVREAYADGAFIGYEEDCRHRLAGEYIEFPLSKAEIAETRAEYEREQIAEGVW